MGDSNNCEGLSMISRRARSEAGVPTQRGEQYVLHQAVDEDLEGEQEFRSAKEGICTTEDNQSAAGFGGHL